MKLNSSCSLLVLLLPVLLGFAGCVSEPLTRPPAHDPLVARFFVETRPEEPGRRVVLPQSGVEITIDPKPVVMEFDIVDAEVMQVALGRCLQVKLTPAATRDLYRITGASVGRRLVLTLNDEVLGARKLDGALGDGTVLIFLERADDELPSLVERLKRTSAEVQREVARKR